MIADNREMAAAIIVAAGSGTRIGGDVKKQFLTIHGKPVLQHTLERFQNCHDIDEIVVVAPFDQCETLTRTISLDWKIGKLKSVVAGGSERYHSVNNGIKAVSENVKIIAVHDGVRPCVREQQIVNVVKQARAHGAAILAVKPKDTIKAVSGDFVQKTLDRNTLVQVQTPQAFDKDILLAAYRQAEQNKEYGTDDASLVELTGTPVFIVPGDYTNIKITSPDDLALAGLFLEFE